MAALTRNKQRQNKLHKRQLNAVAGKGGEVYFVGALLMREAATALCVPAADTANAPVLGVIVESRHPDDPDRDRNYHLNLLNAADGTLTAGYEERVVVYDQVGEYSFAVSAGTPLPNAPAYVVDDDTVSATATTNSRIAGWFTRPAPNGGWFVDISKRNLAVS